jgi:hypothetical protein
MGSHSGFRQGSIKANLRHSLTALSLEPSHTLNMKRIPIGWVIVYIGLGLYMTYRRYCCLVLALSFAVDLKGKVPIRRSPR